jgi:hypothetical protein
MRAKWLVLLSLALVLVAVGAERLTAWRVRKVVARKDALNSELEAASRRQIASQSDSRRYKQITAVAAEIAAPLKSYQTDPTQMLRWFAEAGVRSNVRLLSSKINSSEREGVLVAGGAYNRFRIELDAEGEYASLVRYVERIERAGQPMVVDSFSFFADRNTNDSGKAKLHVSCLTPVTASKSNK